MRPNKILTNCPMCGDEIYIHPYRLKNGLRVYCEKHKKYHYSQLEDVEWLRQKYEIEKLSSVSIAKLVGCHATTVLGAIKRAGIHVRPKSWSAAWETGAISGGSGSPVWKGGRWVDKDGYVYIKIPDRRRMLEHRYVMEEHLGRRLLRNEIVHHINGDRSDNRLKNLKIVSVLENLACVGCLLQKENFLLKRQIKKLKKEVQQLRQGQLVRVS